MYGPGEDFMYSFTCDICGMEFEDENRDNLVIAVQNHFEHGHHTLHEKDTEMSGLEKDEAEIRDRIEENS